MKSFIVLALLVAAVAAAPQRGPDADAQILRFDADNIGVDGYKYGSSGEAWLGVDFTEVSTNVQAYETSNGIAQQEEGSLKNAGSENEALEVRGQFSYTGPDGVVYTVNYIANEDGFQPTGAHLPQAQ